MSQNNGTTVNTTPATVWYFNVLRTSSTLTLVSVSGAKSLTFNLKTLVSLWDTLTETEQDVYTGIENEAPANVTTEMALTMAEMNALKSISEKITPLDVVKKSEQTVTNGIFGRTHTTVTDKDATNAEHRISRLENIVKACNENYYMVQYDIPTEKNEVCPSPCVLLWRHSFRTSKSVWIMPESSLGHQDIIDLFQLWTDNGVIFDVMMYDPRETEKIKRKAMKMLDEEIRRTHTSLIESIASADDQLKEALAIEGPITPNQQDKAEEYRDNRVRAAIRKAAEHLDNAIHCAELFDQEMNVKDLLNALRETVASHKSSFNVRMYAKNRKPV